MYFDGEVVFESAAFEGFVLSGATDACYAGAAERLKSFCNSCAHFACPRTPRFLKGACGA